MAKTMLICKACGKEYEACRTPNPGIFRWRDVACSLECAQKYIHDVQVARGEIVDELVETPVQDEVAESNADIFGLSAATTDNVEDVDNVSNSDVAVKSRSWKTGRNKKK